MAKTKLRILVVDVHHELRSRFQQHFEQAGLETFVADTVAEAYQSLGQKNLDVVLIDFEGLGHDAIELIRLARQMRDPAEVIVLTRPGTFAQAIEAMKLGIFDDLLIPVNLDVLTHRIKAAGQLRRKSIKMRRKTKMKMKKFKILLVDDEEEFVKSLSERLQLRDMSSDIALNGEAALELVTDETPDVMVLDLRMPGIDGLEVLKRVKQKYPEVQVIILTGHGTEKDEAAAQKLGAFAYLRKPVNLDELITKLKKAYRATVEKTMVAAAFAEEGEMDIAREIIEKEEKD